MLRWQQRKLEGRGARAREVLEAQLGVLAHAVVPHEVRALPLVKPGELNTTTTTTTESRVVFFRLAFGRRTENLCAVYYECC